MECSRCHKTLDIDQFSYKNEKQKIYYLYCNNCREKTSNDKKNRDKEQYEIVKLTNSVKCACGKQYITFRDFHIKRHYNSKSHIEYIINKSTKK